MHYKNNGRVKNSIVKNSDLLAGRLSIWRLSKLAGTDLATVEEQLLEHAPEGQELSEALCTRAGEIRAIRIAQRAGQSLCVLDECEVDEEGNAHPAHAHIALCEQILKVVSGRDDPLFQQLKNELVRQFLSAQQAG
jgi:hypothetical protein